MGVGNGVQLISVYPEELTFELGLGKPCHCNLKLVNNTEHHVAYKMKTTLPKKYFVRPNTGVVQPWDSCIITVTLHAQQEYSPDMQCKDKFLIQSTIVPPSAYVDEVPKDTFNRYGAIEECKLRVVYTAPGQSGQGEESGLASSASRSSRQSSDDIFVQAVQSLKQERDATLQQNQQLQQELEMLKRHRNRNTEAGFSLTFAAVVGVISLMLGFILKLLSTSPPTK